MRALQGSRSVKSGSTRTPYLALIVAAVAILATIGVFLWALGLIAIPNSEEWPIQPEPSLPDAQRHQGVGLRFTGLELKPLVGDLPPISSADVQGQVVLLNFWGPWCPPCRQELPHVVELAKHFADRKDFCLAAISYPPGGQPGDITVLRDDTVKVLDKLGLKLSVYCDPDSATLLAIDRLMNFEGFPTTVLLDRQGMIRAVWVGYMSGIEDQIEQLVDNLLLAPAGENGKAASERSVGKHEDGNSTGGETTTANEAGKTQERR